MSGSCNVPDFAQCSHAAQAAEDAADSAVRKVFAILGVDLDDPKQVEEFREDLRFGAKLRKLAEHSVLAFFGAVATAFAAAVWVVVTNYVHIGKP